MLLVEVERLIGAMLAPSEPVEQGRGLRIER